jgi:hypothetical protein
MSRIRLGFGDCDPALMCAAAGRSIRVNSQIGPQVAPHMNCLANGRPLERPFGFLLSCLLTDIATILCLFLT